jgi:hypothetical protein
MCGAAFGEDGSRLRKDRGPENMAILGKPAMTVALAYTGNKKRHDRAAETNGVAE